MKQKILIISEGGAGLPVAVQTEPSPRLYVDSAFLNVITALIIAKRHKERGDDVTVRFGVQYFTSANEYHIPESFESYFYRKYSSGDHSSKEDYGLIEFLNQFQLAEEGRKRLELHLSMFLDYIDKAPVVYSYNGRSFRGMFNYMGKMQKIISISNEYDELPFEIQLNQDPNTVTKALIEFIAKTLEIHNDINIIFDKGPRLELSKEQILKMIPDNLKTFKQHFREILRHLYTFMIEDLGYNPPDSFPITIASEDGEIYNGIRYLFNDKNYVKFVRTYMGQNLGYFDSRKLDRAELISRIEKQSSPFYFKFPIAVFEGEMIVPIQSADVLLDMEKFSEWKGQNIDAAKEYSKVYVVEGIDGYEGNPHTIGLRERIIRYFASDDKYIRVRSPNITELEYSGKYVERLITLIKDMENSSQD
ncbi:MAG: hypothetical protein QXM92_03430 [Candidatus Anstonellales archaeon]